jgi:hypothetical protein
LEDDDNVIKARVNGCHLCRLSKLAQSTRVGFLASEIATTPMEKIFIDNVGPLPRSRAGNPFALVAVDAFSKFAWIFPVRRATSAITIACLKSIFATFGVCRHLVYDNGPQFTFREFQHFVFGLGIHHFTTTTWYMGPLDFAFQVTRGSGKWSAGRKASLYTPKIQFQDKGFNTIII